MSGSVARLAPSRMDNQALIDRARTRIDACRWEAGYRQKEIDAFLNELDGLILELQARLNSVQLDLYPNDLPAA